MTVASGFEAIPASRAALQHQSTLFDSFGPSCLMCASCIGFGLHVACVAANKWGCIECAARFAAVRMC
jgi:hypothetical protein